MSLQTVEQLTFDFIPARPVVIKVCPQQISGDAGLLVVRQFDQRWRFTQRFAECLVDRRNDPDHTHLEMVRQRIYGILAGYEDCNDHDALRDEPVFKMIADRLVSDEALASQPTLSRFENGVHIPELHHLIDFAITMGVERLEEKCHKSEPETLTLDLDTTDDPTHGHQQLALFHGYYDQYQYLPLIISEATTRHILMAWLRPGTLHPTRGGDDSLKQVMDRLWSRWPKMTIHVRGDADFGLPTMLDCCEGQEHPCTYTFGLRSNAVLARLSQDLMDKAVRRYQRTGRKQRLFARFMYRAESWPAPRQVIAKAECHAQGTNRRFVVTNLPVPGVRQARAVYDAYVQRGESEQRMDELKNGLNADRLSCHRFLANFLRLQLHIAAYNLFNALRDHEQTPEVLRRAQPATWRTKIIKVAAMITLSCRRLVVQLSSTWPFIDLFHAVSRRALLQAGPAP